MRIDAGTHEVGISIDFIGRENGCFIYLDVPDDVDEKEYIDGWVADNLKNVQGWN